MATEKAADGSTTGCATSSTAYSERMQRKKAVIDERVAAAQTERGVLLLNYGSGKGKSTAAFGLVARALGHEQQVAVVQFVKSRGDSGEEAFFRRQPGVHWHVGGEGFTWETQDKERDAAAARHAWQIACGHLADAGIALVVLDEFTYALKYGWLDWAEVAPVLTARPPQQSVVITGRGPLPELRELADTVSEVRMEKHAFAAGIAARRGVEW